MDNEEVKFILWVYCLNGVDVGNVMFCEVLE